MAPDGTLVASQGIDMKRGRSSRRWLQEHFRDEFVRKAHDEGWRSRGVYKLQEIDARDKLLRPGMVVVDLGAAPGGWSDYVYKRLEGAKFVWPQVQDGVMKMSPAQFSALFEGLDWRLVRPERVRRPAVAG